MLWLVSAASGLLSTPPRTALRSPPGYEAAYAKLRELRAASSGPLLHIGQLSKVAPDLAEQLSERVDFLVPRTRLDAAYKFFRHPTALFISGALTSSAAARATLGVPFGLADVAAALATALFWLVQEWVIHAHLLHSATPWYGSEIHRWHHELPYFHVSMDGFGLAATWFGAVAVLLVGAGLLTHSLAPCLTSLTVYTLYGGVYELAHYLAHTRAPLPRPLDAWRRHHAQHHCVSDR
jgi:hypothetical protein